MDWYPKLLRVGEGESPTLAALRTIFEPGDAFAYAEFGIYRGATAEQVCSAFPHARLYLFDFEETIEAARRRLGRHGGRVRFFGNSQRYNDSYNWSLAALIAEHRGGALFDYCFLDGAHTWAVDALCFFLCDRLLKPGGHLEFDDYEWRLRGSSLDPAQVPAVAAQYTDEQIDAFQVRMIVDLLVATDPSYEAVIENRLYRKAGKRG